jgi:hypothetical protein
MTLFKYTSFWTLITSFYSQGHKRRGNEGIIKSAIQTENNAFIMRFNSFRLEIKSHPVFIDAMS